MPAIRRLLACIAVLALPVAAQSLAASTDLLPIQATPGAPPRADTPASTPPAASTPAQPGTPRASPPAQSSPGQSFPSRGGYQCERSRPTS